jgi:HSP20 family protein
MRESRLELMHDHVRAIYKAVAGSDPPEPKETGSPPPSFESVAQNFAELEALARSHPLIAERVPPFSFAPPLDVIGTERELIFELGVPGVERSDVEVELADGGLRISGARSIRSLAADGRIYLHAEMARGPFLRVVQLREATSGPPRVEVENGVVRVRLAKAAKSPLPRA